MRAALTFWGRSLVLVCLAGELSAQKPEPLRKTDLIRLLTGGTMSTSEIAELVKRNCLSFTPTARDRENLTSLGADSTLLARIDACTRQRTAPPSHPAATPGPVVVSPVPAASTAAAGLLVVPLVSQLSVPVGGAAEIGVALKRGSRAVVNTRLVMQGSAQLSGRKDARDAEAVTDGRGIALFRFPVGIGSGEQPGVHRLTVATASGETIATVADIALAITPSTASPRPANPVAHRYPSAARTGFVLGSGERGVVGQRAVIPVVFEVRDTLGVAIAGFPVQWTIVNGHLTTTTPITDSAGQARAEVVFGDRAGSTVVTGTAGGIVRQATLYAGPGRPARLIVERGGARVDRQLLVSPEGTTLLRVYCRDGFDNALPLTGLSAAVGDESIVRVTAVTTDSAGGWVTLRPGKDGITNLTVQGSGVRADLSAMVRR